MTTTITLNANDRACRVVLSGDEAFDCQLFKHAAMTALSGGNRLIVIGDRQPGMDDQLRGGLKVEFFPAGTVPPASNANNCVLFDGLARRRAGH